MNRTSKLITSAAIVTVLTGAGVSYAVAQGSSSDPIAQPDLQRASDAAVAEAGGGAVTSVESDDGGYEVEVRLADGTELDVDLDRDFAVVRTGSDPQGDDDDDRDDRDDAVVDDATRQRASDAAVAAVGDGTVTSVESDDGGYDVEVRLADGSEVDVRLGADLTVTGTERDDD